MAHEDFRRLNVYQRARVLNKEVFTMIRNPAFDRTLRDQLGRASISIMLNIAEGATRMTKADRRRFFIIARSSAMECSAIFDVIEDFSLLPSPDCEQFRNRFEELSRMLFALIKNLEDKNEQRQSPL
jgi:four helix bundle protein